MKTKTEKKKINPGHILRSNLFALKTIFKICPEFVIVKYITDIAFNLSVTVEHTFLVAYIISCAESGRPFTDVLKLFIPLTSFILFRMFFDPWLSANFFALRIEKIKREINLTMYKKAVGLDISSYDDPEFYNDFVWAMRDAPQHVFGSIDTLSYVLQALANAILIGVYMATTDAWGIVFVVLAVITSVITQTRRNKLYMQKSEERKPPERRRDYVNRVFYLAEFTKDMKMSGMADKMYAEFERANRDIADVERHRSKKLMLNGIIGDFVSNNLILDGMYITYLLYNALYLNSIGYGAMVALYEGSGKLRSSIQTFARMVPQFQEHSLYLDKMIAFLNRENKVRDDGTLAPGKGGAISISDVSFRYPGAGDETLKNISLNIRPGEKIALVGYNGAGKSTLIKLLLRLYDPTNGTISYDGKPYGEYKLSLLRKKFGAVFQDYELMAATLGENITMSREALSEEKCLSVFRKVGFENRYNQLPKGFDTPLTKEFDDSGTELSGGEAQKVVISRILYSDADFLVLDEPSSALDPISEYQLNHTIMELSGEKTVIIISHRLSTTRSADRIYMLDSGRIIEEGTHDELISSGGRYAEMFNMQAEKYRNAV